MRDFRGDELGWKLLRSESEHCVFFGDREIDPLVLEVNAPPSAPEPGPGSSPEDIRPSISTDLENAGSVYMPWNAEEQAELDALRQRLLERRRERKRQQRITVTPDLSKVPPEASVLQLTLDLRELQRWATGARCGTTPWTTASPIAAHPGTQGKNHP